MIDKDTLEALSQGPAITAAATALNAKLYGEGVVALPDNFNVHDLEMHLTHRRRLRGSMATSVIAHFAAYVGVHAEVGATVFVDPDRMNATAVLNLGAPGEPGHADNTATFSPKATAAYRALVGIANGQAKRQSDIAEFLEDWRENVRCQHGEQPMEFAAAVAAIRKVTIESLSKRENTAEQLSESRSAFDQVRAVSGDGVLPTRIVFSCAPYVGFEQRTFEARLAIITGEKAPSITLRIVKAEEHAEKMAEELAAKVTEAIGDAPVLIGSYSVKA